mgnify:CR=1 FL=1
MTVLYVFTFGYSLETWDKSGTLQKELKIFKELNKKKNIDFIFLTYGNEKDFEFNLSNFGIKVIPLFNKKKIPSSNIIMAIYSIFLLFKKKKKIENVDLIQQNQLNGSWLSVLLKLLLRKPFILRTGYDTYRFAVLEKKSWIKKFFYFVLTNLTLFFSDIYTVTSESDKEFSNKYIFSAKNTFIRPNWVNKNKFNNLDNRNKFKILSVGRLESQKNYTKLLNDFKDSNFVIDIVGTGSEKAQLEKLAYKNNVKVNFLGKIENSVLEDLYKEYIFYISTSIYEGNPKTVLEAMSNGCITIISNIDNHKELIINKKNGYLVNLNSDFKTMVENLLTNESSLNKISLNAMKFVEDKNLIDKLTELTYRDYKLLTD